MLEIAKILQTYAQNLSPEAQIAAGIIILILGLFLWLGGIGYTRILSITLGALFGLACCYLFTEHTPLEMLVSAAVAGVIAMLLEKAFITLITAALAAAFAFLILFQMQKVNLDSGLRTTLSQLAVQHWIIIAGPAVLAIIAGFYIWPLVRPMCSAALGTIFIFAGMILLLVFKGSAPAKIISEKSYFYSLVFVVMIAFGAFLQLILTTGLRKKPASQPKEEGQKNEKSD